MAQRTVAVSVRQLVEFIMRSGDIDTVSGVFSEIDAMQQGSYMHRKMQKKAGPGYRAEVTMKHTTHAKGDLAITVSGRADGVETESEMVPDEDGVLKLHETVTVEEIKGSYRDIRRMTEPVAVHRAQALCYAYFYCEDNELENISIRMTYVDLDSGYIKQFTEEKKREELSKWYQDLIDEFAVWVRWVFAWQEKRNLSVGECDFPFEYRKGQRNVVAGVYQTIVRGRRLFVEAPTGTGKTVAVLYPAVRAMGAGLAEKIFYLTARTITRTAAEDTMSLMQDAGLSVKVITLTAKDKICIFDEAVCSPQKCTRAKGHFDRVNAALYDMITHEDKMTRKCITDYAAKYEVCPFEFQLDAALLSDVIIGDYNYAFDPDIALKRFFADAGGNYVFLVDEAHNLVDRAREMYSSQLRLDDLEEALNKLRKEPCDKKTLSALRKCIRDMKALRDSSDAGCEMVKNGSITGLTSDIGALCTNLEMAMRSEMSGEEGRDLSDLYFAVRHFKNARERCDERYVTWLYRKDRDFGVKIMCMDPSGDLGMCLAKGCSAVFFSATLLPVRYYKEMLSDTAEDDYELYAESPFDPGNCLILAAEDVSSRYSRRGPDEYRKMAVCIRDVIRAKHGNYMVFFPSYRMMEDVYDIFTDMELSRAGHGLRIVKQDLGMDEDAREAFLDEFRAKETESVIGFCVLGGIFSEGIDLKEDRLIGAVIVGTGLPGIGDERELIRKYFEDKCGMGFEYAYLYPGMNKVLQAGGRVIRTENDHGVIILLDERFNYAEYRRIFPREWSGCRRTKLSDISGLVEQFWTDITQ